MSKLTKKDIDFVLNSGEGLKIEFKESLGHIDRTMVAFANSEGGKIYLGIDDQKNIRGIGTTNALKSRIQDIARNCDPSIDITFDSIKNILIIEVKKGLNKPYKCSDGFFLRIGPNSQKLSRDEIVDLVIKEARVIFDELINKNCDVQKELDAAALKAFLRLSEIKTNLSSIDVLLNLGLTLKYGSKTYLNNAGILFFSKNPQKFLRHANMTCVAFKDREGVEAMDRKDLSGNLLDIVSEAERFVLRNIHTGFRIKGFRREELPEYPLEAIREGFVNALMHRDYFEKGANVILKIFPDKIVIDNPGGLVRGMTIEDLGRKSISRNPLIADLFHRVGLAEKIGSGIKRMNDLMRNHGLKPPQFEVTEKFFTVTFIGPKKPPTIKQDISYALNERQRKAIKYIKENGKITNREYRKLCDVGWDTAHRDLQGLLRKKIIKYKGRGRSTYYRMIIG